MRQKNILKFSAVLLTLVMVSFSNYTSAKNVCVNKSGAELTNEEIYSYLDAISFIESNDDPNAVGDGGRAIGQYQIWKIMVDEVNRVNRLYFDVPYAYTYDDRYDAQKSRQMCLIYLSYCIEIRKLGIVDACRCWNGGHNGYKRTSTLKYVKKLENYFSTRN